MGRSGREPYGGGRGGGLTSAQRRLIYPYYLFHFFLNFQLWWPIWIIYLTEERGLTLGQVTLIDVPFWLSIIVLQVPAAAIADRWGRKPTLIASSLAFARRSPSSGWPPTSGCCWRRT